MTDVDSMHLSAFDHHLLGGPFWSISHSFAALQKLPKGAHMMILSHLDAWLGKTRCHSRITLLGQMTRH